jgi:anti-sigma factor RsiW
MHLSEEEINLYLDGALAAEDRTGLEEHLGSCAACRQRLDELRWLFAGLDSAPEVPLQRDLVPGVLAGLPARRISPGRTPAWLRGAMAIQMALGLGLLVLAWPALATLPGQVAGWMGRWESIRLAAVAWWAQINVLTMTSAWLKHWTPPLSLWPMCLSIAFLVWLIANGFLLQTQKSEPQRRKP